MKVNEIFTSIEGEGIRAGYPATFIRLQGCNLNCSYCDSRYSCEGTEGTEMSVSDVVAKVKTLGIQRITLTGGEPLLQKEVPELLHQLYNFSINIETNGSRLIEYYTRYNNIRVTMDWKSPSSNMRDRMQGRNLCFLREQDVLKFVVGSHEDLLDMKKIVELKLSNCNFFVSPVFGKIEPHEIVEFLLEQKLYNIRMQLQLHKFIWDPNRRGV